MTRVEMCVLRACLAIGFSVMATAAVAEERRELGPHEHGTGRLVVAIEGNRISMALDAPGADVFGFESGTPNAEQKKIITARLALLKDAAKMFPLPATAGCVLEKAEAEIENEGHDDHAGHGADKGAHGKEGAEAASHADVAASYEFACKAAGDVRSIRLGYFDMFPGAQKLEVAMAGPKGQTQVTILRANPQLDLSAAN